MESQCHENTYDINLPPSSTNTVGILESVICRFGDTETDYCKVLFRYAKQGLERFSRVHVFEEYQDRLSWYENPIRGHRLEHPPLDEVFPGQKGGDLFLNWIEYPVRCQIWRFRTVQWDPFREAKWEPLPWAFQDPETKRILVLLIGENVPVFVSERVFSDTYEKMPPAII